MLQTQEKKQEGEVLQTAKTTANSLHKTEVLQTSRGSQTKKQVISDQTFSKNKKYKS